VVARLKVVLPASALALLLLESPAVAADPERGGAHQAARAHLDFSEARTCRMVNLSQQQQRSRRGRQHHLEAGDHAAVALDARGDDAARRVTAPVLDITGRRSSRAWLWPGSSPPPRAQAIVDVEDAEGRQVSSTRRGW